MRIQKYLSQEGILSRRKAEEYLLKGWIKINGQVVKTPGTLVEPGKDKIELSTAIQKIQKKYKYIAYYKPRGVVTNLPHPGETEIRQLLPPKYKHLHAIGRLDKESEGLILLTDDGVFARQAIQGPTPHERVYNVQTNRLINPNMQDQLEQGMILFGEKTLPLKVKLLGEYHYQLTMIEGKNRQIRRMMQKVGAEVITLKRISFGPVKLDLHEGKYRELTEIELKKLKKPF
jgi:pseudouridine synthase